MKQNTAFYLLTDTHYVSKQNWVDPGPFTQRERGDQQADRPDQPGLVVLIHIPPQPEHPHFLFLRLFFLPPLRFWPFIPRFIPGREKLESRAIFESSSPSGTLIL